MASPVAASFYRNIAMRLLAAEFLIQHCGKTQRYRRHVRCGLIGFPFYLHNNLSEIFIAGNVSHIGSRASSGQFLKGIFYFFSQIGQKSCWRSLVIVTVTDPSSFTAAPIKPASERTRMGQNRDASRNRRVN